MKNRHFIVTCVFPAPLALKLICESSAFSFSKFNVHYYFVLNSCSGTILKGAFLKDLCALMTSLQYKMK